MEKNRQHALAFCPQSTKRATPNGWFETSRSLRIKGGVWSPEGLNLGSETSPSDGIPGSTVLECIPHGVIESVHCELHPAELQVEWLENKDHDAISTSLAKHFPNGSGIRGLREATLDRPGESRTINPASKEALNVAFQARVRICLTTSSEYV